MKKTKFCKKLLWQFGVIFLSVLFLNIFTASAVDRFEHHGYMRAGVGINSESGDQEVFVAPGAEGKKYRLGNENDNYIETDFVYNWQNPKEDEAFFKGYLSLAFGTSQNSNYSDDEDKWFNIPEAYVQAGNIEGSNLKFWAGNRFYRRHDIHMNDFYFFSMSGYGAGVEDVELGAMKMSLAYLVGSEEDYKATNVGRIAKNNIDLRFYDIDMPFGKGMFAFVPSWIKEDTYDYKDEKDVDQTIKLEDSNGYGLTFIHTNGDFFGGFNKLSIQYGAGTGVTFDPNVYVPKSTDEKFDDMTKFRVTNQFVVQPSDKFSMMTALVYQIADNGKSSNSGSEWYSAGIRPVFHLTDYYSIALEGGIDYTSVDGGDSGALYKFTVAPQLQAPSGFWGRPVLRMFATMATWSDDFKGDIAGDTYKDDTSGFTIGAQMEVWW